MSKPITKNRLRNFNLVMGGLHLVQGIAILILSKVFTLPINGTFLKFNEVSFHLEPATKVLFDLSLRC